MLIGVPAETEVAETRIAATPETVKKFVALGIDVAVERGAGIGAGVSDSEFLSAGARLADSSEALRGDVVLKVRRPNADETARLKSGALVLASMDPYGHTDAIEALAKAGASSFAMELLPRITRAQVMDVLSSQANLAGYGRCSTPLRNTAARSR
jgi:H+-translocating NAD(P) transhydrogenase subunit alpha